MIGTELLRRHRTRKVAAVLCAVAGMTTGLVFAPSASADPPGGNDQICVHLSVAIQHALTDMPDNSMIWQCTVVPNA